MLNGVEGIITWLGGKFTESLAMDQMAMHWPSRNIFPLEHSFTPCTHLCQLHPRKPTAGYRFKWWFGILVTPALYKYGHFWVSMSNLSGVLEQKSKGKLTSLHKPCQKHHFFKTVLAQWLIYSLGPGGSYSRHSLIIGIVMKGVPRIESQTTN